MDLASSSHSLLNSTSPTTLIPPIMHLLSTAVLVGSVAVQTVLGLRGAHAGLAKRSVTDYIAKESPAALDGLFCNIGPAGCNSQGAGAGIVVASPSANPNYVYSWTRDAALVFKYIVDSFVDSYDENLQQMIEEYITAQAYIQTISNPSGSLSDGRGLAEPKFNIQPSAFNDAWGRPQRDGPPLRAITMITYSKWLIANGYQSTVSDTIWPIVQNDLNYVAQYWNQTGFDLWEEVSGSSFFTIASSYRALFEGSKLAATLGKSGSTYASIAPQVLCFMQSFWVPSGGFINSNINQNNGRSGKDVNSILTAIHNFDPSIGCDSATFQPCSDKALSNHKVVVDSMRFWGVNAGSRQGQASAVGRYPEDIYFAGNPWYLATFAAAEQLYDALHTWDQVGSITVTALSLPFFQDLVPGIPTGQYMSGSPTYSTIVAAVSAYADGFVNVAAKYTPANGALAEQFDKNSGAPLSAADLTWSYASFLTAAARRAGSIPTSWADGNATSVPLSCNGATAAGSYAAVSNVSFPPNQTPAAGVPAPTGTSAPQPCSTVASVAVTFKESVVTQYGQTIKMVGNSGSLGNWDPAKAVELNAGSYTDSSPVWTVTMTLPAGETIQYKYINVAADGTVTWESDPNHSYTVPKGCKATAVKSDRWQ